MHLDFEHIPDAPGWLILLNVMLGVLTFLAFSFGMGSLLDGVQGRAKFTRGGKRVRTLTLKVRGVGLLVVALALSVSCVVGTTGAIRLGEQRVTLMQRMVIDQAQARYGVQLNADQADELTVFYRSGFSDAGSTEVLLDGEIVDASLYHVGDVWVLSRGAAGKRTVELPVVR